MNIFFPWEEKVCYPIFNKFSKTDEVFFPRFWLIRLQIIELCGAQQWRSSPKTTSLFSLTSCLVWTHHRNCSDDMSRNSRTNFCRRGNRDIWKCYLRFFKNLYLRFLPYETSKLKSELFPPYVIVFDSSWSMEKLNTPLEKRALSSHSA